jgi:cystathionine beta-synthase
VDQYDNPMNPQAHYESTGPEIWAQMGGKIDWFVASGSTGGTVTGIGRYLKERDPKIQVSGLVSAFVSLF